MTSPVPPQAEALVDALERAARRGEDEEIARAALLAYVGGLEESAEEWEHISGLWKARASAAEARLAQVKAEVERYKAALAASQSAHAGALATESALRDVIASDRLEAEARASAAEAERDALRGALEFIRGCGCPGLGPDSKKCAEYAPDHPGTWCPACVARRALSSSTPPEPTCPDWNMCRCGRRLYFVPPDGGLFHDDDSPECAPPNAPEEG